MRIYDGGTTVSNGALRRFCLLQPGFLGCAKLKQAAVGDVTHVASYASGRDLSPGGTLLRMRAVAYCKILRRYEQPPGHYTVYTEYFKVFSYYILEFYYHD